MEVNFFKKEIKYGLQGITVVILLILVTILVTYCFVTNYSKLRALNNKYFSHSFWTLVTVLPGASGRENFTRLHSNCWLELLSSQDLTGRRLPSSLTHVILGRLQVLTGYLLEIYCYVSLSTGLLTT